MYQYTFKTLVHPVSVAGKKAVGLLVFLIVFLPGFCAFGQQVSKIQQTVNSIKETFNNTDNDYITDGQRTVWVKSYKNWTPGDLVTMTKEVPGTIHFLYLAVQHNRYDVLEQLLPDYYSDHGGVNAFANDIVQANQKSNPQTAANNH